MEIDKKIYVGGLDSDTSDKLLAEGDYRFALNIRNGVTEDSDAGEITNTKGNIKIPYTLPNGDNYTIGTYFDYFTNRVYYFNHNSTGQHHILEYSIDTKTISLVLQSTLLNFNKDYLITAINAYQGLLYWTDDINPPRKINIQKAKDYSAGNSLGYPSPLIEQYIQAIMYPHNQIPTVEYYSDSLYTQNNIRNTLWQFRVQFVYDDNELSAWSPISITPLPEGESALYGNGLDVTINNCIKITTQTGEKVVKKINIATRKANDGTFYLIETLDKEQLAIADNSTYTYSWYNDSTLLPIDPNEIASLFDNVPQLAKCQEIINSNRLVYQNIVEGYDNTPINVEMFANAIQVPASTPINLNFNISVPPIGATVGVAIYTITTTPSASQVYTIDIDGQKFSVTSATGETAYQILTRLGQQINTYYTNVNSTFTPVFIPPLGPFTKPKIVITGWRVVGNQLQLDVDCDVDPRTYFVAGSFVAINITQIYKTLKRNSFFQYGIVYYDYANRSGATNISPQTKFFVPSYKNTIYSGPVSAIMHVKHLPPDWATHYQVVRTKNLSIKRYINVLANGVSVGSTNTTFTLLYVTNFNTVYPNSTLNYDYTAGDRVRALHATTKHELADMEISKFDDATNTITVKNVSGYTINTNDWYEIYTPEKDQDGEKALFYEIGEYFPIVTDASGVKVHGTNPARTNANVIQNSVIPTSYTELWLDDWSDYYRYRALNPVYIEASSYSDLYSSDVDCSGRPNIVSSTSSRKRLETTARYSQPYIQDTNINGLSTFFDVDFESYDNRYGSAQKLFYKDGYLISFMEDKIANIPVNQRVFSSTTGQQVVGVSDQVLNLATWYSWEGGISKNPESFANYGNAMYFTDVKRGTVNRLSIDGVTPISEYKMHNFFTDHLGLLNETAAPRIWGVYDRRFSCYVITMAGATGTNYGYSPSERAFTGAENGLPVSYQVAVDYQNGYYIFTPTSVDARYGTQTIDAITVAFFEPTNRWISFYSYYPEATSRAGVDILTFLNGEAYLHNSSTFYNNFYGITYPTEVWTVSNILPSNVKIWESVGLESTEEFEVYEATTPNGQKTQISLTDFENKENMFYAYMKNDENTPNVVNPIINGDVMRDTTLLVKLRNSSTNFVKMFATNLGYIISNLHNR